MAMDGDVMGSAIAAVLINRSTVPPTPDMAANIQQFWKDVAAEVVIHIQEYAEVPAGIGVSTTGTASAQTGATTGAGQVQ